jgi:3-methyladenine DNA glycosylase AlkD
MSQTDVILKEIRSRLLEISDEKSRLAGERFFKESVKIIGVKSADVGLISRELYKQLKSSDKSFIFGICDQLWSSQYLEESFIACNWAYNQRKNFDKEDFKLFEMWVEQYVTNWASCDTLCNHTIGTFIDMFPQFIEDLKRWTKSSNRWQRRAAAVSLIVPGREGRYLDDAFQISELLLLDEDDMVRKGYGWLLKVCSNKHQERVFDFVMKRKDVMPRTSLRYAIEKMPDTLKTQAMQR